MQAATRLLFLHLRWLADGWGEGVGQSVIHVIRVQESQVFS